MLSSGRSGIRRGEASVLYSLCAAEAHHKTGHPESPERILCIQRALSAWPGAPSLTCMAAPSLCSDGGAALATTLERMQPVHSPAYLRRLEQICASLQEPSMVDDSTYICPGSFDASCQTAAAVLNLLDSVLQWRHGRPPAAFCLGRPPGHHVLASRPMGFGLVNVVSIAAAAALQQPNIHRVAVVDVDVHHGNGTEDIFFADPDVLYISTHQQGLWPYTGKATSLGAGAGEGATINVPLPGGAGHDAMLLAFGAVVEPALRRFQPDVLLVSAGFDAHWQDPLAGLQFRSETYHWLCQRLRQLACELCGGRCLFVLEGGYHTTSLAESVLESMRGLCGDGSATGHADAPSLQEPLAKTEQVLRTVARLHDL